MRRPDRINFAVQRGAFVYAYGDRGNILLTVSSGDGLLGYTAETLTVRRDRLAYTYNLQNTVVHVGPCN